MRVEVIIQRSKQRRHGDSFCGMDSSNNIACNSQETGLYNFYASGTNLVNSVLRYGVSQFNEQAAQALRLILRLDIGLHSPRPEMQLQQRLLCERSSGHCRWHSYNDDSRDNGGKLQGHGHGSGKRCWNYGHDHLGIQCCTSRIKCRIGSMAYFRQR